MADDEYVVEAILKWRFNFRKASKEYLVKWANYTVEESTWEPEHNLSCPDVLRDYIDALNPIDRRNYKSPYPNRLNGFQRHANVVECLGSDGPHDSDDESSDKPNKQTFYCLVLFDDSESVEEVTIEELIEHNPREAMNFYEARVQLLNPSQRQHKATRYRK